MIVIFFLMILCHILDDFVLQPVCLSNLKQKRWWDEHCYGKQYNNDYKTSKVREYCNTTFYNELVQAVGAKNILKHKVELMADDGTNKNVVCFDNVSILTTELYRKYRQYIPECDIRWWWTATPVTSTVKEYSSRVCCISTSGVINWDNCDCIYDVRPFCVLSSSVLVS